MTTTGSTITHNLTPTEAASLLAKLEEGHQAAWRSTNEAPLKSAEHQSRFQNAAEVDGVFRDILWETLDNGLRRPGESVQQFASRVQAEARLAAARTAGTETIIGPITQQAGAEATPERPGINPGNTAARLLSDPGTPLGRAYATAFSATAAARVRELRERDPLPEPNRTPGAPHPDPFLASRGWHVNEYGLYTRRAEPAPQAPPEREPEAGL